MREHFQRLARYNRWANRQIYGACAKLSPDDFHAPRAAFFPSIARTLNHIMVGDRIWMGRFVGEPSAHRRLDEVPYQKFAELDAARQAEDDRILAFFEERMRPGLFLHFEMIPDRLPPLLKTRIPAFLRARSSSRSGSRPSTPLSPRSSRGARTTSPRPTTSGSSAPRPACTSTRT